MKRYQTYRWQMLIAVALLYCGSSFGQEWTWSVELVDSDGGTFNALAVDNEGNVHVGYLSPEGGGTKYGFRPLHGRWFNTIVDKNNGYVNLALDKEQRPHLCYSPVQTLKHARWDGSKWVMQEIAPHSGDRSFSCGIAIGADDAPHVTWYQYTDFAGQLYLHVKHAVLKDFAWQAQTLDFGAETGKWNCVRVDSQGGVHVSYSAFRDGALRYAYHAPGGKWVVKTIEDGRAGRDNQTTPGMGNSMVLDKNGKPNFSYRDEATLRYAWPEGDHWRIDVVDASANPSGNLSWINMRTSLAFDADGRPHIVYETDGALKHAWWNGSKWRIQPMGISGPEHRYGSLAISQDNVIYIGFSDPQDGSMKVLVGKPKVATTGTKD
jgi:hypothetical protein